MTNDRAHGIRPLMIPRPSLFRSLLLLLLAAGPLQAQTVLLCDMMEVPRQETCCCDEMAGASREAEAGQDCDRPPCHIAPRADSVGCCDSAVEISHDPEADAFVAKPPSDRPDPDPSAPILFAYNLPVPPGPSYRTPDSQPAAVAVPDGSKLYLRTERLRI